MQFVERLSQLENFFKQLRRDSRTFLLRFRTFKAEQGAPEIIRIITSLMVIMPVIHRLIHVDLAKQANTDFVAFGINNNILFYLIANDQV